MTPNKLKIATQNQLRDTRDAMLDLDYSLALEKSPLKDRQQSGLNLLNTQRAYLKLRKTKLATIRADLENNNADLEAGIEKTKNALKNLTDTRAEIDAISAFLAIVARIVPLL